MKLQTLLVASALVAAVSPVAAGLARAASPHSADRVPSPTWCVRACPEGTPLKSRLWQGIPKLVKDWERGGRDATLRRLQAAHPDKAGTSIRFTCARPAGASAARPVPVFFVDSRLKVDEALFTARGYALVRGTAEGAPDAAWCCSRALDWVASQPDLDETRVAALLNAEDAAASLWAGARDERLALTVACGVAPDADDLLRLVAPRPVYLANGTAGAAARALYRAYRLEDRFASSPALDWERVLAFADLHVKRPSSADSDAIEARVAEAVEKGTRSLTLTRNAASPDGVWRLTRAILVPDSFTLVFDGCRVELVDGTQDNLVRNAGAAEGGGKPNRGLRILGRNGAVLSGGRRNHYLPKRSGDPNGWRSVGILLCDVTDYEVGGFAMEETQCWAISQERCSQGRVHDIVFGSTDAMYNQDGVDLRKGCHDIVVENISGSTGDDAVALTAYRDPEGAPPRYGMQIGGNAWRGTDDDVYNVTIRNVCARSAGGHGVIRLLVCDGIRMHHISVENVVDTASGKEKRPQATIRLGDVSYHKVRRCAMGEMHHITVRDVKASGRVAVWIKGPMKDSSVTGIREIPGGRKYDITAPTENVTFD